MKTITANERLALQGILDSDFMDGATGTDAIGKPVWSWSANVFAPKMKFGGVSSSLVRKGYIKTEGGFGREACISITEAGFAALLAHDAMNKNKAKCDAAQRQAKRDADRIDGYDRDDLGESPDF